VLENEKQLLDVLMFFQQDIYDLRHRQTLDRSPPVARLA
jgi:hypothetical protein